MAEKEKNTKDENEVKAENVEKETEVIENDIEKELDELNDRYKRLFAEFENYKKRNMKERESLRNMLTSDIMMSILPIIDNLEKDLTDTKRQRFNARYLLNFLLNFAIQSRSTGTEQVKALAQEINVMLEPLASITELEVCLLIERLQDLGILRPIVWEKKAREGDKDFNKDSKITNYTLCFSDLSFIIAAGFNTALNFLPDLNLISDVEFKFALDFLDGLWELTDAIDGNNNIIIENYVYKAFLSNIATLDNRITIQFSEDCEAGFSLVIKDLPNLITKEIKINVDDWSYLCRGEWIQLQNLEDTIIAALHDR